MIILCYVVHVCERLHVMYMYMYRYSADNFRILRQLMVLVNFLSLFLLFYLQLLRVLLYRAVLIY